MYKKEFEKMCERLSEAFDAYKTFSTRADRDRASKDLLELARRTANWGKLASIIDAGEINSWNLDQKIKRLLSA